MRKVMEVVMSSFDWSRENITIQTIFDCQYNIMYVNKINAQSQNKTNILQESTVVNNFIPAIRS